MSKPSCAYYPYKFIDQILRHPFELTELEFKVKSRLKDNKDKGSFLIYVDTRAVERRMNIVFGPNWESKITSSYLADDRVVTTVDVSVKMGDKVRIFSNIGEKHCNFQLSPKESRDRDPNAATSSYAQAFKRACTKLGIGEYIYHMSGEKDQWVDIKWNKPVITDSVIQKLPSFMFPTPINERLLTLAQHYCEISGEPFDEDDTSKPVTFVQECLGWKKGMSVDEKLHAEAQLAWLLDLHMMKEHGKNYAYAV